MCDEIKVSYITINYNSSNYTIELIKSIEEHSSLEYEIIVVDNKSDENDFINLKRNVQNKPKVKLIRNTSNDGFSAGNMIGTKYAKAEYFFFINNDTRLLFEGDNNSSKINDITTIQQQEAEEKYDDDEINNKIEVKEIDDILSSC